MKRHLLLLCLGILITGFQLQAQKVWSLEDCITHAIENNIQIKQRALTLEEAFIDVNSSKWNLLPNLNLNASNSDSWGPQLNQLTGEFTDSHVRSNSFSAQSTVTLFNGFQKLNTIRQSQLNQKATEYDFERYLNDVSLNIATYYLQTLFQIDNLKNAEEQYKVTEEQVERTKKLVNAGKLAKGDLLSFESRAASERLIVIEAENALQISYLNLAQLLDIQDTENFSIQVPQLNINDHQMSMSGTQNIFNTAVDILPEIKSAKYRVQSAEKGLSIAKGGLYPSLSSTYGLSTLYSTDIPDFNTGETSPFNDQMRNNFNQSLRFNLSIPIFNGLQQRSFVARQKIAVENSKLNLELEKQNLYKKIQQSYTDAIAALNRYEAAEKKLEATQTSFEYATTRYEIKDLTYVEFIEAKKEFDNANRELLSSKYDYIFKKTILDFYKGMPISLTNAN